MISITPPGYDVAILILIPWYEYAILKNSPPSEFGNPTALR